MRSPNHLKVKEECRAAIPALMFKHHLGIPERVVLDDTGWVNPCIFVNDAYVFRFNARDPELPKYQREKIAFDRLCGTSVPVPGRAILDDSKTASSYDVLVSELIPGRNLETDWSSLSASSREHLASEAGRLLRLIHQVQFPLFGELSELGPLPKTKSWLAYLQAKLAFHLREAESLAVFNSASVELFWKILLGRAALFAEVTSPSLVHVDYHFGNLLYQREKITGVIDFEWSFAGDPLYDLCRWRQSEEEWPNSRSPFLTGYGCVEFTGSEVARIDAYQMLRNIELCVVARLHFSEAEAQSFKETTLLQASKL